MNAFNWLAGVLWPIFWREGGILRHAHLSHMSKYKWHCLFSYPWIEWSSLKPSQYYDEHIYDFEISRSSASLVWVTFSEKRLGLPSVEKYNTTLQHPVAMFRSDFFCVFLLSACCSVVNSSSVYCKYIHYVLAIFRCYCLEFLLRLVLCSGHARERFGGRVCLLILYCSILLLITCYRMPPTYM